MKAQHSYTSVSMLACLVLLSLGARCNQPTAAVSLAVSRAAEISPQAATIQIETGSGVLLTTSLDLTIKNMGKAATKSFSPHKHGGQDYGLSVSCCFVGAVELVDNNRLNEEPIEGDVIGLQVSLVTLETNEPVFSETRFSIYNQNETVAFNDKGVKITISPQEISD